MDSFPYATPPRWWSPRPRPLFVRWFRPIRHLWQRRHERIAAVEMHGLEHLRDAIQQGAGVLIAPNHAAHSDPFLLLNAAEQLGRGFYFMAAWQSFLMLPHLFRWIIRWHGCFSVDREGNDFRAYRQALDVVGRLSNPLVLFPEGEVYHNHQRLIPFRTGVARVALAATRRQGRPVLCVPAGIAYQYVQDPTPDLVRLLDAVERRFLWQPRSDVPLAQRMARATEGFVTLKEVEYLGRAQEGRLPLRLFGLIEMLLGWLEHRYAVGTPQEDIPQRVTRLRGLAIARKEAALRGSGADLEAERDLAELHTVTQLFSYAADDPLGRPTIEHLADIADRLEEDVLGVVTATPRAARRGFLLFGEPLATTDYVGKDAAERLTADLEGKVRSLLEEALRLRDRQDKEQDTAISVATGGSPVVDASARAAHAASLRAE